MNETTSAFPIGRPNHSRERLAKGMHWCSDCEREYPVEAFNRNRSTATGYDNLCKRCKRVRRQDLDARKRSAAKQVTQSFLIASYPGDLTNHVVRETDGTVAWCGACGFPGNLSDGELATNDSIQVARVCENCREVMERAGVKPPTRALPPGWREGV